MILLTYAGYTIVKRMQAVNAFAGGQVQALVETWEVEAHGHKPRKERAAPAEPVAGPVPAPPPQMADTDDSAVLEI